MAGALLIAFLSSSLFLWKTVTHTRRVCLLLRSAGFFPEGYAQVAVPCNLLTDLQKYLLEGEISRQGIDQQIKNVRVIISGLRAMAAALKKGCGDMASALNTVRSASALRERNSKGKGQGQAGRLQPKAKWKLPSYASTSDPSVIKVHKHLSKTREILKAATFESLKDCKDSSEPFILRQGKFQCQSMHGCVLK